ncbi:MAG: ABC transporter ATP-binding protein [Bacteroides sp.]|nr:ABC transporter ATP-binding protein [Bacteroides sp.]
MIQIENLVKNFGTKCAVDIDSLTINDGELVGLVGNNGAGKTTLFRLILDLLKVNNGSVKIDDKDVTATDEWKKTTGAFIDEGFLIDYLTPDEFFYFIGKVHGKNKQQVDEFLSNFSRLMNGEILGQKKYIRNFSSGNKQKIGIISAMINTPKLLILDEPFNYLDPSSQVMIKNILKKYNEEHGATVIVSSHNLNHTVDLCKTIVLLENGKVIKHLTNDDNAENELQQYFSVE